MESPLDIDTGTPTNTPGENERATMDVQGWKAKRIAQIEEGQEPPAGEPDTETRNEANEPQHASTEPAPADSSANIPPPQEENLEPQDEEISQLSESFKGLTQEQKEKFAREIGTGLGKRLYDVRQRAKVAEQKVAELSQQKPAEPWVTEEPAENPCKDLNTVEELQEEYSKAVRITEWAEEGLYKDPDDDGFVHYDGGQGYTRPEVGKRLLLARKTMEVHVPKQGKKLAAETKAQEDRQFYDSQGKVFFPEWWEKSESFENQVLENMMSNPALKSLAESSADGKLYLAAAAETLIRRGIIPGQDNAPATGTGDPSSNGEQLPQEGARPNPPIMPTGSANTQLTPTTPRKASQNLKELDSIQAEINNSGAVGMDPGLWKRKRELQNKL